MRERERFIFDVMMAGALMIEEGKTKHQPMLMCEGKKPLNMEKECAL